ncbi:hypothetical protein Acr_07g0000190 [Actinidia rufa]|uniref:Uncharacterized protein n=1 Tax=Actinidia rufa TaxID=165716 RepID=A0A7J0ETY8_9ERIC|nr:hypothetical protein Acr_07g0000190 [Actinidia rufa]
MGSQGHLTLKVEGEVNGEVSPLWGEMNHFGEGHHEVRREMRRSKRNLGNSIETKQGIGDQVFITAFFGVDFGYTVVGFGGDGCGVAFGGDKGVGLGGDGYGVSGSCGLVVIISTMSTRAGFLAPHTVTTSTFPGVFSQIKQVFFVPEAGKPIRVGGGFDRQTSQLQKQTRLSICCLASPPRSDDTTPESLVESPKRWVDPLLNSYRDNEDGLLLKVHYFLGVLKSLGFLHLTIGGELFSFISFAMYGSSHLAANLEAEVPLMMWGTTFKNKAPSKNCHGYPTCLVLSHGELHSSNPFELRGFKSSQVGSSSQECPELIRVSSSRIVIPLVRSWFTPCRWTQSSNFPAITLNAHFNGFIRSRELKHLVELVVEDGDHGSLVRGSGVLQPKRHNVEEVAKGCSEGSFGGVLHSHLDLLEPAKSIHEENILWPATEFITSKDIFSQTREDVKEQLSTLRRKRDTSDFGGYLSSRRNAMKAMQKLLKALKIIESKDVLLALVQALIGHKPNKRDDNKNIENLQKQLGELELSIEDLEEALDLDVAFLQLRLQKIPGNLHNYRKMGDSKPTMYGGK